MGKFQISGLSVEETKQVVHYTPILIGYRGSIAHNKYVPSSDPNSIDDKVIMAVSLGPIEIYIGLSNWEGKDTFIRDIDCVTYEFRKYIRLLLKSNPNVLSLLWLEPNYYVFKSTIGEELINKRHLFSSKKIYKSFTGYAYGQLQRMEKFTKEGYMGEKRAALVKKFGYDTKNAAHCIRLLRMAVEFLNDQVLYVTRHDKAELLSIKHGEWTLERVKQEATRLFIRAEEAYDRTKLPVEPNYEEVEKFVIRVLMEHLETQKGS